MTSLAECPMTRLVTRLRQAGCSLAQIAVELSLHRSAVYRRLVASGEPRRWRPLTEVERERIRVLLEADLSRRVVARLSGRGLGTVARVAIHAQPADDPPDEPQPLDRLQHVRHAVRCPGCGAAINVLPCVTCAAREAQVCRHGPNG
jgi:hypothetical protein